MSWHAGTDNRLVRRIAAADPADPHLVFLPTTQLGLCCTIKPVTNPMPGADNVATSMLGENRLITSRTRRAIAFLALLFVHTLIQQGRLSLVQEYHREY